MFVEDLANDELKNTENGASAFNTSGNALVDLNFKVPSMRKDVDYVLFEKSLKEDTEHTLKWLLYLRDIRNGIGERKSFREICVYLSNKHEELFLKFLMAHLEEFGRYDDLVYIAYNTKSEAAKRSVIAIIINQLEKDVENMNSMFKESAFNGDISKWNVSNVRIMESMFRDSVFNKDISKWDVSNVENMRGMFQSSKFDRDISKWNVRNVEDMSSMFLYSEFNQDISKWNVRNVKDMRDIFRSSKFAGDISDWDVRHVKYAEDMFDNCPLENKSEFQPEF